MCRIINFLPTLGLCADVALEFLPPVTNARLFTKDKYLEPMFGDVSPARTKAAILLLPIATNSSRTCTKPTVEPTPPVKMIHQINPLPFAFTFKYLNYAKKMSTAK